MRIKFIEINEVTFRDQIEKTKEKLFIYFYTPLCGTCKVAEKMLTIASSVGNTDDIYKIDANFSPWSITNYKIKSVPCLLIVNPDKSFEKNYVFKSVQDVYEIIKKG